MRAVAFFFPVSDLAMRGTETHAVWDVRWYYSFLSNVEVIRSELCGFTRA